ncbi:hypothetical protein ACFL0F_00180 [Patescibacteria group bacterium]
MLIIIPMEIETAKQHESIIFSEETFKEILEPMLGDTYERALKLFRDCGPNLSFDITNVLHIASSQGEEKLDEVLERLEKHYNEHLAYQHPEIRGCVRDNLLGGINPTHAEFLRICSNVLGLEPNPPIS